MAPEYDGFVRSLEEKKLLTAKGVPYWMGRDLMDLLTYVDWRNFNSVIERAVTACGESGESPEKHFVEVNGRVSIGSGAEREREDWFLTRYACYLVAMNGDPAKQQVSFAMTYFARQTRKQEVQDLLTDDEKRLELRLRVIDNNKALSSAAQRAGVRKHGLFQDGGIRGLYGMGLSDLKAHKQLSDKEDVLDHAGRLELAANDFRITLTEHRLKQQKIQGEGPAIQTHRNVGEEVRGSVMRDNGVKPENLPKETSIKKLVDKHRRELKKSKKDPGSSRAGRIE